MPRDLGGTRWRRFAAVLLPSMAAASAVAISLAQGALAASFFISGEEFKTAAGTLTGEGLSIYGMVDVTRNGDHIPVLVTGVRSATIEALCQSVVIQVPVLGPYTLRLTGGEDGTPARVKNLFLDTSVQRASQAVLHNVDLGIAAGSLTTGEISRGDRESPFFDPNGFALQGTSATLTNVRATGVAASASTIDLPGLHASLKAGKNECF
ncbi:DUF6230 family protein [Kitasatospora sp. GP82]|uniref:DUF6230 family protein n=1 Tax=Kitasatospora sp. GP82 TaxID=3035089 RepID=UPI002475A4C1|nr:DUF6230 family protein [Kitasatospora sp. GP82]MDH6126540.1 hypothetical protein [Kitasatospora sp. GP82]